MSQLEPVAPTPATAVPYDPALYNLPDDLTPAARKLCRALLAVATHARKARGYVETTTHVTLHLPVDLLAESLGCHRVTVRRAARQLRAHGLIDSRPHVTTAPGISDKSDNVRDGTLWAVRLNPGEGAPARLTNEELRHTWRDLAGDRRRGRTAYRMVQAHRAAKMSQSNPPSRDEFDL